MIPRDKIEDIISKYDTIERELSSGNLNSKEFAQKSKDYSDIKNIIEVAQDYLNYDKTKKSLKIFPMIQTQMRR